MSGQDRIGDLPAPFVIAPEFIRKGGKIDIFEEENVMALAPQDVEQFFDQHELPYTRAEDDTLWYAEIAVGGEQFEFFVNLDEEEGWIYFTINPFVPSPDPECLDNLCRHLVRLNYDVTMAKFVIDDEDDVALMVELPAEDLAYSHFAAAIAALSKAAGENYDELSNLSQDATAVSSYK